MFGVCGESGVWESSSKARRSKTGDLGFRRPNLSCLLRFRLLPRFRFLFRGRGGHVWDCGVGGGLEYDEADEEALPSDALRGIEDEEALPSDALHRIEDEEALLSGVLRRIEDEDELPIDDTLRGVELPVGWELFC